MNLIPVLLLSSKLVYFLPLLWTTFPDGACAHKQYSSCQAPSQTLSFLASVACHCEAGVDLLFWISSAEKIAEDETYLSRSTSIHKSNELSLPFMKEYSETLEHSFLCFLFVPVCFVMLLLA